MKKLFLFAIAIVVLASCSKDDDTTPPFVVCPTGTRVSFEAAEKLTDVDGEAIVPAKAEIMSSGSVGHTAEYIFWAKSIANKYGQTDKYDQIYWQGPYIYAVDGVVMVGGYYENGTKWDGKVTDVWGGFSLSQDVDMDDVSGSFHNQFDVWAAGGANETDTFLVGYDSNSAGADYGVPAKEYNAPQIDFSRKVSPYRVFLANSTYVYGYFSDKTDGKLTVVITGWVKDVEGKSVACKLIDGAVKVTGWVDVDLSSLGAVDKLTFKIETNDTMAPFYFCLDDLCFN